MKRVISLVVVVVCTVVILSGANFTPTVLKEKSTKKNCIGYTIIEAGKGINCSGDTIALVKKPGFFEVSKD